MKIKKILFLIIIVASLFSRSIVVCGQGTNIKKYTTISKELKKSIKKGLKKNYTHGKQPVFVGNITLINDSVLQYEDKIIELCNIYRDYKPIFYKGVLNTIISEPSCSETENKCIKIWKFREVTNWKRSYKAELKTKLFIFEYSCQSDCDIIILGGISYCYMELKNEQATESTSIVDFIAGATLIRWMWLWEI